jgi:ribosomal protein S18 acetylase RimI-like enzyme
MSEAAAVITRSLRPEDAGEFLRFFDHERGAAFADNPEWAKCYCRYYHVPKAIRWASLSAPSNREAMEARIKVGEMEGSVAYEGAEVVGWVNAQARHKLVHCFARMGIAPTPLPCQPFEAAAIVCFVVSPSRRRRGIARALLRGALESLAARGFKLVDAFPFKSGDSQLDTDHFHGPLSLFLDAGFSVLGQDKRLTVVRKLLAGPA